MFDQLFERPHAVARHRNTALASERLQYLQHLADQNMARMTLRIVAEYLVAIVAHLRLGDRSAKLISQAEIEQQSILWATRHSKAGAKQSPSSRARFVRHATGWLQFMGQLQQASASRQPCAKLIATYGDYLRQERGLALQTIAYRCRTAQQFLGRLGATKSSLRKITIAEIDQVLMEKIAHGGYARVSVQTFASSLRGFLRYLEMRGCCRGGLAAAIKAPRVFSQERLPTGPSWAEVQRLLALTEGDRPTNIRDRAILMLLTVYGLRSGELVHLRLEDFDWEQELLLVRRSKTREAQKYPLVSGVGNAVIRYLKQVRPRSDYREVFLTLRAPFQPLHSGLWRIVARRLRPLGVSLPHHGPHALRHACATRLLSQGLSLKEIGDHLGHRDPDTTRIYAKVDLLGLRQVADLDLRGIL